MGSTPTKPSPLPHNTTTPKFVRALGGLFYTLPLHQWQSLLQRGANAAKSPQISRPPSSRDDNENANLNDHIISLKPVPGLPETFRLELLNGTAIVTRVTKEDLQEISDAYAVAIPPSLACVNHEAVLQVLHHELRRQPTPLLDENQFHANVQNPKSDEDWKSGEDASDSDTENSPDESPDDPKRSWFGWISHLLQREAAPLEESGDEVDLDEEATSPAKAADIEEPPASVILSRRLRQSLAAGCGPSALLDEMIQGGSTPSPPMSLSQEEMPSLQRPRRHGTKSAGATPNSASHRSPMKPRKTKVLPTIDEALGNKLSGPSEAVVIPSEEPPRMETSARQRSRRRGSLVTPKRKRPAETSGLPPEWEKYVIDSDEEEETCWHRASPATRGRSRLRSSQRR